MDLINYGSLCFGENFADAYHQSLQNGETVSKTETKLFTRAQKQVKTTEIQIITNVFSCC